MRDTGSFPYPLLRSSCQFLVRTTGLDVNKFFTKTLLTNSGRILARRLESSQYRDCLEGEDWQGHYADIDIVSPAIHNVMRSFVVGRLDFIRTQLGQDEIEKSSFLDVGDSDGVFIRCLGKKGTSINTSAAATKQIARRGGIGVQSDGTKLPFPDSSYDYVLCFETLEHLPNPMAGLLELERVCRKGVIISVPHVKETTVYPAGYFPDFPQEMLHIFELSPAALEVSAVAHEP